MYIDFSDIPGHQNLFLDYLNDFEKVAGFYPKDFRETEKYEDHFKAVLGKHRFGSEKLHDLIANQYSEISASKTTNANIEMLKEKNTLTVVTGQQVGILGGPLYTIYKIITAIKLSRQLKENYNDFNFVPVFWLEGDDHDFAEIRSVNVFGADNNLTTVEYDDGLPEDANRGNVGFKEIDDNINTFFDKLLEVLRRTEYTESIIERLKTAYISGTNFKDAFFDLIFSLFDENGLIIFDPTDINVKKSLVPIFSRELKEYRLHTNALVLRSAALEETYHAQVKIRPINLFLLENKERVAIEPGEEGYKLRGKRKTFTEQELFEIISHRPDKISPNVILRPICQDYLFPTAFYIGGPGEISYFGQVCAIYEHFDIEPPIIYPRSSATIIEKNLKGILEKYEVDIRDIFIEGAEINKRVVQRLSEHDIPTLFDDTNKEIEKLMEDLKEKLSSIDPALTDLIEKSKERIYQTTLNIRTKAESSEKRRFETALRQLDKAVTMIFPNGNLQEREVNFLYFANKYGIDIHKWLFEELSINKFEHQFIEL